VPLRLAEQPLADQFCTVTLSLGGVLTEPLRLEDEHLT
jgi:hypothetical protein